ncbi:MAG: hypothetical protein ACKOWG_10430 [Planctomycetia bacterium]
MSAWYSTTVHHVHGPHTASELKRLATQRLLAPDALIGRTANGPWIPAARIRGLFATPATGQAGAAGSPPAAAVGAMSAPLRAGLLAWLRDGAVPGWKRSLVAAALAATGSTALIAAGIGCRWLFRPNAPSPVPLRLFLVAIVLGMGFSALQSLCIGIRGLVRRRPIVFSSRTVMLPVMAILATSGFGAVCLVGWTAAFRPWDTHALLGVGALAAQAAISLCLMYILWREATGYLAYGVGDDSFRDALVLALHRHGHPFRETLTKIELLDPHVEIRAVVQPKIGTALIRTAHRRDGHHVAALAAAMNAHYRLEPVAFNKGIFVLSTIQGVAGVLLVLPLAMMLLHA